MSVPTTDAKTPGSSDPEALARYWQIQLELASREEHEWREDATRVVERYRSERKAASSRARRDGRKTNILYANTETLRSAIYARPPQPYVERRFDDADPVGGQVAGIVERALVECGDGYDGSGITDAAVLDMLLVGRGVLRVTYAPVFAEQPVIGPMGQPAMDDKGQPVTQTVIADQKLYEEYVFWQDVRFSSARTWADMWWIAFRHRMDKDDLVQNFGAEAAATAPLNWSPKIEGLSSQPTLPDDVKRAEVWEIWHKPTRRRLWIVLGAKAPLRVDDDPYGLADFWPMPEPIRGITTTDTFVPQPEFEVYRDQADDLDEITSRISRLTKALKRRGIYDAAIQELRRLATAGDNEFIPTDKFQELAQKGGLKVAFQTEDLAPLITVLTGLYEQRDKLVQAIYELTGISDILRGASDPQETMGAQQIKAQFGSLRLQRRQRGIQRWLRDLLRLKAEIIAEHFQPDVLQTMTGQQVTPQVMQVLRSDKLRSYRVDVETDSTVFIDEQAEQAQRTQLVQGLSEFIAAWGPIVEREPLMLPLAFTALSFAVRAYHGARELEDVIEQTKQALQQKAQAAQAAPPQPNPQLQIEQTRLQGTQMKAQAEGARAQADVQKSVIDLEAHRARTAMDLQRDQAAHAHEMQRLAASQPVTVPGTVQ